MPECVETIVIGGGQAGLVMSHELRQRGIEHLVLERARIAERWRSERWDSLRFQFPSRMIRLPGRAYAGTDPDGFMPRDEVVAFLAAYALQIAAPVRCGVAVDALARTERGRFRIQAGDLTFEAAQVVVATGPYQAPRMPEAATRVPPSIHQVSANRYTNPSDLPPGGVLVVGSGGSGCQIVEDLLLHGRSVHFALRGHRRVPRRHRGRDFGLWNEAMGLTDRTVDTIPPGFRNPLVTGVGGGRTIDLRGLPRNGATLLGSLQDVQDGRASFAADLNANLDAGDESYRDSVHAIDHYIETNGIDAEPAGDEHAQLAPATLPDWLVLDLREARIGTIVWALGYRFEFGWIACDVFDATGAPSHRRGMTRVPGLHFLGLPRLHKVKSTFLWGVADDAAYLADRIHERSRTAELSGNHPP